MTRNSFSPRSCTGAALSAFFSVEISIIHRRALFTCRRPRRHCRHGDERPWQKTIKMRRHRRRSKDERGRIRLQTIKWVTDTNRGAGKGGCPLTARCINSFVSTETCNKIPQFSQKNVNFSGGGNTPTQTNLRYGRILIPTPKCSWPSPVLAKTLNLSQTQVYQPTR